MNETNGWWAMANSVCWYGHVIGIEDGHILRRALDFDFEGQGNKGKAEYNIEEAG